MTSEAPVRKTCPKCRQVDVTTFSTCRNCGAKYDFKAPDMTEKGFNFLPVVILAGIAIIAVSAYQYLQVHNLYVKPDQLIGKTVSSKAKMLFVSSDKANLLSLSEHDFKALNPNHHNDVPGGGGDAGALNSLASISDGIGVWEKYMNDSRFSIVHKESSSPFSLKVVAASASTDKYPLVQVEFLNGPRAGSMWWVDSNQLDLSENDRK
jgi:hypothetical protein